jgi:uncharacterized PurR-regulated membrane protein YhhQ (DUF165 family)
MYLTAIVSANLSVFYFGKWATVINAFLFIGLNITSRDKLHERWNNKNLILKMGALILAGSVLSYLLNKNTGRIAIASFLSFVATGVVDTIVYQLAIRKKKFVKINLSNVFSSLVDSILFPTLAFGLFMPLVILGQFLAKVFGGLIWSLVLKGNGND